MNDAMMAYVFPNVQQMLFWNGKQPHDAIQQILYVVVVRGNSKFEIWNFNAI